MKKESKIIKMPVPAQETEKEKPDKNDLPALALYLEKKQKYSEAARIYERLVKKYPLKENNYNRLLLIYRKLKDPENELRILNTGITAFENFHKRETAGVQKHVLSLSKKLNNLMGLTDKKGKSLYDPQPLLKWKNRKKLVLKKMK